jgi:predicted deacylase
VYYSPVDGQNLNRVFPGKADGTLSERIAHVITTEIINRATHVADLHGGDGNESLRPYSYWITTGAPDVAEQSRAMAIAFGLDHIVVDRGRPTDPAKSSFLSNTAITRGKPAITTEAGDRSRVDEEMIGLVERGVAGLLMHLGMRDDGPIPLADPYWIERDEVLRAGATGLFYPAVVKGQMVDAGALLGRITDFHGTPLEEFRAPFGGEVLYIVETPPISTGEPIGMVAAIARGSATR